MASVHRIDLNSDIGESFGNYKLGLDEEVIPLISSANLACGFHAGDPHVMKHTISMAKEHGTAVGAHPGFPDLMGFGRRRMDASLSEIQDFVVYQVGALQAFAACQGMRLQHVKPHGALYNMAVKDPRITEALTAVLSKLDPGLILLALAGPNKRELEDIAKESGIRIAFEFFADRAYNLDGSLVPRGEPGAVIEDGQEVSQRVVKMVTEGSVISRDGTGMGLTADTICVHGDNPAAVNLAGTIRKSLQEAGIEIAPFGSFL